MKTRKFTVSMPRSVYKGYLVIIAIFVVILILNTFFSPTPYLAMYIAITIFIFIPCSIAILWLLLFKVTVKDQTITVRRGIGTTYSFDVTEIVKVTWKVNLTAFGKLEKITIKTSNGRKVSIETLMAGFDKMSTYISENVDPSKIKNVKNVFKNALE